MPASAQAADQRVAVLQVGADGRDHDAGRGGDVGQRRGVARVGHQQLEVAAAAEATADGLELVGVAPGQRPAQAGRRVRGEVVGGEAAGEAGGAEEDDVEVAVWRCGAHPPGREPGPTRGAVRRREKPQRDRLRHRLGPRPLGRASGSASHSAATTARWPARRPTCARRSPWRTPTSRSPPLRRAPRVVRRARARPRRSLRLGRRRDRRCTPATRARQRRAPWRRSTASAPVPSTVRSENNETGTNVQEAGVDEPDVVKVAGDTLFRIQDNVLTTYDITGDEPEQLSSQLPRCPGTCASGEILVSGDRVVVLGNLATTASERAVVVVDVSRPGPREIVEQTDYTATISAARLHGDVVRVVLDNGLPDARLRPARREVHRERGRGAQPGPRAGDHPRRLGADRRRRGRSSTAATSRCPRWRLALGTTTVVTFEAAVVEPVTTAVATTATTSYFSPDRFYLATTAAPAAGGASGATIDCIDALPPDGGSAAARSCSRSPWTAPSTTYIASGTVEGQVRGPLGDGPRRRRAPARRRPDATRPATSTRS